MNEKQPPDTDALYRAQDFEGFWLAYERAHADPRVRYAHAAATLSAATLLAGAAIKKDVRLALLAPLIDYAIAQASHRVVARNTTRPWRRPAWHLRAELRLFRRTVREMVRR